MKTTKTYETEIKNKYLQDEKSGNLRANLYNLTRRNIGNVCLNIIDEDLSVEDEKVMRNYFKLKKEDNLRREVENYNIEGFRPIYNFLKGETESIQLPNALELIAILIDFTPRPYTKYRNKTFKISSEIKRQSEPKEIIEDLEEKQKKKKKKKSDDTVVFLPYGSGNQNISEKEEIEKNDSEDEDITINNYQKIIIYIKNNALKLILSTLLVTSIFIIISLNQQRWMVWHVDHYVEVKFDIEKYDLNQLKLYKKERILNFKKITPDCNTTFFKSDGTENLWYGKNIDGKLEYFTDLGLHPETGTTLKKITNHMIKKYICDTY